MVKAVNSAPASLQVPYLRVGSQDTPQDIATAIAHHCGSKLISHPLGSSASIKPSTSKNHVICVDMPPLDGTATHRKATLANHGWCLLPSFISLICLTFLQKTRSSLILRSLHRYSQSTLFSSLVHTPIANAVSQTMMIPTHPLLRRPLNPASSIAISSSPRVLLSPF